MPMTGDVGQTNRDADVLGMMRAIGWIMLAIGAVVCGSGLVFKPLSPAGFMAQLIAAIGFAVGAVVIRILAPRRRVLEAGALACIPLLCGIMGASNVIGSTPYFFLWPVIYLAYFSSERVTIVAFAGTAIGVVAAAALNATLPDPVDTMIGVISSVGVMSALVVAMGRRHASLRGALIDAAHTDALTGLPNRRAFMPYLDGLVSNARQSGRSVVLAIFDLDHFKHYNDTYGHLAGDRALARFAEVLLAQAPAQSRAVRLGGEEFALAFDDVAPGLAEDCVEAIVRTLRRTANGDAETMTTSVGVCVLRDGITSTASLMQKADSALYQAKSLGRDRVCHWTEQRPAATSSTASPDRRRRVRDDAVLQGMASPALRSTA